MTTPIIVEKTPISGTHIISGLEHATMYTVTVVTYNEDGIGPQTASDSATTPESSKSWFIYNKGTVLRSLVEPFHALVHDAQ